LHTAVNVKASLSSKFHVRPIRVRLTVTVYLLAWFLPARRYASAGNSDRNVSVCPSVCPSRAGIVSKQMISSTSGSPKTLVFWRQISSPNSLELGDEIWRQKTRGFLPNGGLEEGWGVKIQRFSSFNVNISKTVADRAKVTIND